jgi:isopenicillin N synthase-like dioxygenase
VAVVSSGAAGIPSIDISALFRGAGARRDRVDARIAAAAAEEGFMIVGGLPADVPLGPQSRSALLRIFSLPEQEIRKLWRWNFEPRNPNVYRGWFPAQMDGPTYKEGIDIGPDIVRGEGASTPPIRCSRRRPCRRRRLCRGGGMPRRVITARWSGWRRP